MPGNFFDQFDAPAAAGAAPFTGVIPGVPKPPPAPTPLQLEDQAMERERLRLAQEAAARQAAKDTEGTGEERTAGFLAGRIVDAVTRMSGAAQKDRSALAPTLGVEAVRTIAGDTAANYMTDAERQQVRAAQLDILDAALTLGTGAAYNREQLEGYRESYFPKLGDDPSTVASKNAALRSLLVRAQTKAGKAAPDIETAIKSLDALIPAPDGKTVTDEGLTGTATYDPAEWRDGKYIGPQGGDGGPQDAAGPKVDAVGASLYGLADTVTFGTADELAAGLDAAFGSGSGSFGDRYSSALTAERAARDKVRQDHPVAYTIGQFGGALVPMGAGAAAGRGIGALAGLGAIQGGAYGVGSADGGLGDRAVGGVLGAGLGAAGGAAAGYVLPRVSGALNRLANTPARVAARQAQIDARATAQPIIDAAAAEGVPISRPFVDPTVRNTVTALETTRGGNAPVRRALGETADAIEGRVADLSTGAARDSAGAGELVQEGGRRFIARSRGIANRLYGRAEQLTGNATATPANAIASLDRHITELRQAGENANGPQIAYLEGLRDDLSRGPMSISALRTLRSQMRGQINARNLTATDAERRVGEALDAASQDIEQALAGNPQALNAYRRADQFYRQRQTYINDVVQRFLGPRDRPMSPEQAFAKLQQMTSNRGDSRRLGEMMRSLDPQEAADVAATFAEGLGRDAAGNFSPTLLVTQAERMSPRARQTLFGQDGAASLENLMTVSREFRAISGNLNNSRTGVANNYRSWLARASGLVGGAAGFATSGGTAAVAGGIAARAGGNAVEGFLDGRAARLLMSPDFTRWLNSAPATANSQAITRHFNRLQRIAERAPYLAGEIQALQGRIVEMARLSGPVAAEEKQDSGVRPK